MLGISFTVNSVVVGMMRRGIPREETVTYTAAVGPTNSRAVVKIFDTNIENQMYTIEVLSADRRTVSLDHRRIENIGSLWTMSTNFNLRSEPLLEQVEVTRRGLALELSFDGEPLFIVNPVAGDQCLEVPTGQQIIYRNSTLTIGSNVFNDISGILSSETVAEAPARPQFAFLSTFQANLQSIDFGSFSSPRPEFTIEGPAVVCVSQVGMTAFIGGITDSPSFFQPDNDFIDNLISQFNMISASLSAPMIAPAVSTFPDEVTTSGQVVQIGTSSIEVQEDIFYFSLRCELSNLGNPPSSSFSFTRDDQVIPNNNVKFSITGDTLLIKNINEEDEGNYTCTVSNAIGMDSETTEIIVNPRQAPTVPEVTPPTPPPPPSWVPEAFSEVSRLLPHTVHCEYIIVNLKFFIVCFLTIQCSVQECGVGIRARAVVCREANRQ